MSIREIPAPVRAVADLAAALDGYRTCELLTVTRRGLPIAWPTVSVRRDDGTFLVTTSIALPQKAFNVRRDPRVALLFSDPTGSGLEAPPQVLVQGTAECPDEIVTSAAPAAEVWRRLKVRQPASSAYSRGPIAKRLFDWYYMRLLITVTPTAVRTRPTRPGTRRWSGRGRSRTRPPDGSLSRSRTARSCPPARRASSATATTTGSGACGASWSRAT